MTADLRLLLLVLALGFVIYLGIRRIRYRRSIRTWPTVTGAVTSSRIELQFRGTHSMHVATVNYAYVVAGTPYSGWFVRSFVLRGRAEQWTAKYPDGTPLLIRYNPTKILDSWVLEKEQSQSSR
jgi:hypothetical protein